MKNYFSFSRSQQIGVWVWLCIILGAVIFLNIQSNTDFLTPELIDKNNIAWVNLQQRDSVNSSIDFDVANYSGNQKEISDFEPNQLTKQGWIDLGFSQKQADVIISFKLKNNGFKFKEDLQKVYVISPEKYAELEPHILLESRPAIDVTQASISLNMATIDDLIAIPGIGEFTAENVIKKRNSLGGFHSATQLHEVYKMNENTYQILVENTIVDPEQVKTININTASKDEIDKHPYIDFAMTAAILKQREQSKLTDLNFLLDKKLVSVESLEKLIPYIRFE